MKALQIQIFQIYNTGLSLFHNTRQSFNASVPLWNVFRNSAVLNDSVYLGLLTCQTFTKGHFRFNLKTEGGIVYFMQ